MFIVKNNKSSFYQIVYKINGKKTASSTNTSDRTETQKILEEFKKSFTVSVQKNISTSPKDDVHSLSKFKSEYLEYLRPIKSKNYIESIDLSFNQFISFCGNVSLKQINNQILDRFISSTFARTQRGAHHYYRTLKAAFNKAVEWNYIESNPFTKVKFPRLTKVYPAFLTEDDLLIILANTPYQYLKDIFLVAFYTGMRLGELINMRMDWINLFNNQILVKCSDAFLTKNKKERIIPMSEKVKSVLTSRFQNLTHQLNEVVFYRIKGKRLHQETISKQFKDAVRKSNLNDRIHFHSLRHSFAGNLANAGAPIIVLRDLMGHSDISTIQIYSHVSSESLQSAINKFNLM